MEGQTQHYTVLARRFRPQTFDDVVGQQPVAQALRNAIQGGRVAHAYLFTGARGVGKTSMARILAKALNCPNAVAGNPCNECEICEGIAAGQDVDVLEIDGASNRGIDDIRSLRANVTVKSMRTQYKLYIIDEVHMLTKEAFNALLKTLEEPPPNVKFVFCTTEPNKVPDTILSRCQRFDFATIETQNIITRLHQIAEEEGYEVTQEALELVARRANGSMRDSQSLFDQLLAFGEEKITAADVHRLLGTAEDERLVNLVTAWINRDQSAVLTEFHAALAQGVQLSELFDQLVGYLRDLMVLEAGAENIPLLGVSESQRATLQEQANQWGLQTILAALEILAETKTRMFRLSFGRALAEMALIRIALLEELQDVSRLIETLRTGNLPELPLPKTPQRQSPQNTATESDSNPVKSSPQKKSLKPEDSSEDVVESEPVSEKTVEFSAENEKEILAQLVDISSGTLKTHLKNVNAIAISGPKHLAFSFDTSYHFAKQYCEQPERKREIEELVQRVTGELLQISFQVEEKTDKVEKIETDKPRAELLHADEDIADPYVQKALDLFGATPVKRVEEKQAPAADEDD